MNAKLLRAQFHSHLYLLFIGMWRGECEIRAEDQHGELSLIAAGTGSLSKSTIKLTRIFWNPTHKTQADVTASLNGWGWVKK
jgi:hypothetical protein